MKKIIENVMNNGFIKVALGTIIGMVLLVAILFSNPWAALRFVEGDPIPRKWVVESVIAVKEWHCINSDKYQTTGIVADVLLGEGAGKATREALCDHYNEYDVWGTIGFGR